MQEAKVGRMSEESGVSLLTTKLNIPPQRPNLVRRPRLIKRLNQGLEMGHILTLVCAPAGFGKSTLAAEWVAHLQAPLEEGGNRIAWLSLDERDNDLSRFLAYFVAALNRANGTSAPLGKGALAMLQSARPPPAEDVLTSLINDIAATNDRIVLALDDYHLIDSPPVDNALTFLLEHAPPQLHIVIATRSDPNLPVARHRARGQLTELRAADLRFGPAEVDAFLNQAMGLHLAPEEIAALELRTEGWITGLQLAAISLRGRDESTAFINSFAGSHRFVVDYLVEDVLEQQPLAVQNFLLKTAVLSRLSAPLCDAVTNQDDGQATLEMLERNNLFVVGLDGERQWYRYHHLFADLLRRRLQQTHKPWLAELHRRACDWYRENGYAAEAIPHALQTDDFELAADLLDAHIEALWGSGRNSKVQEWLDALPETLLFSRPSLTIFQARYQCNTGRLDAAERSLDAALQVLEGYSAGTEPAVHAISDAERRKLRGRVATTRALICSYLGDGPGIIRHADRALALLPADDLTWRSVNAILLGNAHGFRGDMPAAYAARSEALQACLAAGDIYFIILANLELAITLREQGQLQRTVEICRQQRGAVQEYGLAQSRTGGWLLSVWGETLAELDRLDEALDLAQQGFAFTRQSENTQMFGWSFMCLARIMISRGELTALEEAMETMERAAQAYQMPPWITDQVAAWQARLWLAQGQLEKAAAWAQAHNLDRDATTVPADEIGFFRLFDAVVFARILIAQERLEEANCVLARLLEAAEAGGRTSSVITIKILQALTFQAQEESQEALSALEQALALAGPQGFVRIFVDEGAPMARLLQEGLNRGIAPDYVRRLLAAFSPVATAAPAPKIEEPSRLDTRPALIEPLSDREQEVLQLIAGGLTNREIAGRLYLSLNTVKAHTRNIYGKLEVHSRTQALARARELGLLTST